MTTTTTADGLVTAGFEPVADAFNASFRTGTDDGAACAVYVDGTLAVHLWAGQSTEARAWGPDTCSILNSVSKGVLSICMLMAAEAGYVDLDEPVAAYWPEFAVAGKQRVTVRQAMAHRAGLSILDGPITLSELQEWTPVADRLARQTPTWPPDSGHVYHAFTVGWILGEVLRRTTGLRPQQWLEAHIAIPLDLSLSYGTAGGVREIAPMQAPLRPLLDAEDMGKMPDEALRALSLGGLIEPASLFQAMNSPELLAVEMPGANLVGTAHDVARVYAATTGPVDGTTLLSPQTVQEASRPMTDGPQLIGPADGMRWGSGFMLDSEALPLLGAGSYGHDGAGGHLGFANSELRVGFGYQTRRPGATLDGRTRTICSALRQCL